MRRDLVDIMACPACNGPLQLLIESASHNEVIDGALYCVQDDQKYPIQDSIPNLLDPTPSD
jgi:uncharacterized protein YbaR (Trm112 family)